MSILEGQLFYVLGSLEIVASKNESYCFEMTLGY